MEDETPEGMFPYIECDCAEHLEPEPFEVQARP